MASSFLYWQIHIAFVYGIERYTSHVTTPPHLHAHLDVTAVTCMASLACVFVGPSIEVDPVAGGAS